MIVYSILKTDVGVQALTDKIYITQAPQGTSPPYIVIGLINANPDNLLAEIPNMEQQLLGIDCVGDDQEQTFQLYDACKNILETVGYLQGFSLYGIKDIETGYYRTLFDYSYWNNL